MLTIDQLSISFDTNDTVVHAVKDLSFNVKKGASFGIAGESGSGKTQTMLSIMGLLETNAKVSGSIQFNGQNLLQLSPQEMNLLRSQQISIIFQDPMTALNPFLTIQSQLIEVLIYHKHYSKKQAIKRSIELLNRVQLSDSIMTCYPHELSGGMKQRVAIAMALLCEPQLLIADEATTALDVIVQSEILTLLKDLKSSFNMTLIMITHDLAVISQCCDEVMLMKDGQLQEIGSVNTLFSRPSHPYTKTLIDAVPKLNLTKNPPLSSADTMCYSTILSIKDISVNYNTSLGFFSKQQAVHAVKSISFNVFEGEVLGIVGESGCGKSTLARAIMGLIPLSKGDILFQNQSILNLSLSKAYKKHVQLIFQNPLASLNPRMTIGDIIAEPLLVFNPNLSRKERLNKVVQCLKDVGLDASMINRYPHEFSGGQCQRISIARALISTPKLLICDEPVSALDVTIQSQILDLLATLKQKYQLTILFISHDLSVVQHISDHVMVMHQGHIIEYGDTHQIFTSPKHDYTKQLLDAVPVIKFSNMSF